MKIVSKVIKVKKRKTIMSNKNLNLYLFIGNHCKEYMCTQNQKQLKVLKPFSYFRK